jgi:hypothetical protein
MEVLFMCFRKTWKVALVLALALALSPLSGLKAASLDPSLKSGAVRLITTVAMKKEATDKMVRHHRKRHRMHRMGKRMHSKGPGRCGLHQYYSRKHGRCMDSHGKT